MNIFAAKQKFIELEPEIVVNIDAIIKCIDQEMVAAKKRAKQATDDEMKPWLEKYRLWEAMKD